MEKLYQVQLAEAKEKFAAGNDEGEKIQPFVGKFQSRDRAFAYIGSQGAEKRSVNPAKLDKKKQKLFLLPIV